MQVNFVHFTLFSNFNHIYFLFFLFVGLTIINIYFPYFPLKKAKKSPGSFHFRKIFFLDKLVFFLRHSDNLWRPFILPVLFFAYLCRYRGHPGNRSNPEAVYSHSLTVSLGPWVSSVSILYLYNKIAVSISRTSVSPMYITGKDFSCGKCLHIFLQITLQRSCAVYRVISFLNYMTSCTVCQLQRQLLVRKLLLTPEPSSTIIPMLSFVKGLNIIISSRRFKIPDGNGLEGHSLPFLLPPVLFLPSHQFRQEEIRRADIRSHNKNGIFKINRSSLGICNASVIKNLEKHMKHIRVRFLNFIKQHNTVRFPANCLCKLTALFISYILEALQ